MLTSMAARGHLDLDSLHALSRALAIDTRLAQLEEIVGEREERCVRGDAEQYIKSLLARARKQDRPIFVTIEGTLIDSNRRVSSPALT
jgi:hypothetical protein